MRRNSLFTGILLVSAALVISGMPLFAQDRPITKEDLKASDGARSTPSHSTPPAEGQPGPEAKAAGDLVLAAEYTKVIFIDLERNYLIFNKGQSHKIDTGTKICILGEKKRKIFCNKVEAAIASVSAYHVPKDTIKQIPQNSIARAYVMKNRLIFREPPEDEADAYTDDGVQKLDNSPFFADETGIFLKKIGSDGKSDVENRSQMAGGGFSFGYLFTPKSPVSCRTVNFNPPTDAATGTTGSVWTNGSVADSAPVGLALSYIGTRSHGFNPVYDLYFRFLSWHRNMQNFIPTDDQSYVQTEQLFYSTGLGVGLSRQVGSWRNLRFRPIAGLALERSVVTYDAESYGGSTQANATLAKFTSQLYMLASHLEMEALYVHDYVDIVFSLGSDIPLTSMHSVSGAPHLPVAKGVSYADGADNDLKAHIDHKMAGPSAQMRFMLRYAF